MGKQCVVTVSEANKIFPVQTRKAFGRVDLQLHLFLSSLLSGDDK